MVCRFRHETSISINKWKTVIQLGKEKAMHIVRLGIHTLKYLRTINKPAKQSFETYITRY